MKRKCWFAFLNHDCQGSLLPLNMCSMISLAPTPAPPLEETSEIASMAMFLLF
ncbi:hypothetical protein BDV39DRAFT_165395 [Aspergillus sergii]|uniref:Uncharacterized protein n=1 Tax=Aspergillus sergii TaxID=1034303 RepID=A0A5N6XP66_9EURO|nr:hypothetical protein BDV39DRAFT_165395 [Aspergillus sergii]